MEMLDESQQVEDWEILAQFSQAYRTLTDSFMDQIAMHRAQAKALCKLFVQDGMTQSGECRLRVWVLGPPSRPTH
jgi:hypothetical protein